MPPSAPRLVIRIESGGDPAHAGELPRLRVRQGPGGRGARGVWLGQAIHGTQRLFVVTFVFFMTAWMQVRLFFAFRAVVLIPWRLGYPTPPLVFGLL